MYGTQGLSSVPSVVNSPHLYVTGTPGPVVYGTQGSKAP